MWIHDAYLRLKNQLLEVWKCDCIIETTINEMGRFIKIIEFKPMIKYHLCSSKSNCDVVNKGKHFISRVGRKLSPC